MTGADPAQFRRPTLKRHNPVTVRKNTGDGYRGCLRVEVRRSARLYREIEGWVRAATSSPVAVISQVKTRTEAELPGEDSNLG